MNVIPVIVKLFSFGERYEIFHPSPHENIFTIALINIHYLYNNYLNIDKFKQTPFLLSFTAQPEYNPPPPPPILNTLFQPVCMTPR